MTNIKQITGYPSIDKPWLNYYDKRDADVTIPDSSMYEFLWDKNKDHLDDTAIIFFDTEISYRNMFKNIDHVAKALLTMGVRKGDVVSIIAITTPEILYTIYALSKIGAVGNMIDPRMPIDMTRNLIRNPMGQESKCNIVICLDIFKELAEAFVDGYQVVVIPTPMGSGKAREVNAGILLWNDFINHNDLASISVEHSGGNNPVLIEYTGGTTGTPKGVLLSNYNINAAAVQFSANGTSYERNSICQCVAAPFIAYVITLSTHIPLSQGIACKITVYDPELIAEDIIDNNYSHIASNPTVWEKLIHSPRVKNKDFSSLVMPISGADMMSTALETELNSFLDEHNCKNVICNGYGMTESGVAGCVNLSKRISKIGSVGIPFIKTIISAFDDITNEEFPYNQTGELCITGPSVMMRYANDENSTREVLKLHKDGKVWLHTGDYGHIDNDGFVFIDGRKKRMIIRDNGAKVFPNEVEKTVSLLDGVVKCVLIGKNDGTSEGQIPVLFAVKEENYSDQEMRKMIIDICKKNLQDYAIPHVIVFLDSIPLTPIGKIDYRRLEQINM